MVRVEHVFEPVHNTHGRGIVFQSHEWGLGESDAVLVGQGSVHATGKLKYFIDRSADMPRLVGVGAVIHYYRMHVAVPCVAENGKGQNIVADDGRDAGENIRHLDMGTHMSSATLAVRSRAAALPANLRACHNSLASSIESAVRIIQIKR